MEVVVDTVDMVEAVEDADEEAVVEEGEAGAEDGEDPVEVMGAPVAYVDRNWFVDEKHSDDNMPDDLNWEAKVTLIWRNITIHYIEQKYI